MEDLLKTLFTVIATILVAAGGYVVAWFQHKKERLGKDNLLRQKDVEITDLKNGWKKRVENWVERQEKQICKDCHEAKEHSKKYE